MLTAGQVAPQALLEKSANDRSKPELLKRSNNAMGAGAEPQERSKNCLNVPIFSSEHHCACVCVRVCVGVYVCVRAFFIFI